MRPQGLEFSAFVREHTTALFRSALLLTGNREAAEDLVQDTFVRLYPKWPMVQRAEVPLAYVRRSMMNNFINSARGQARREIAFSEVPSDAAAPDLSLDVSDRDLVQKLLADLPPRQRAVLVLRFFHDLTDAEIADEVGCRQGTVRSIVSRGLAAMRTQNERLNGSER